MVLQRSAMRGIFAGARRWARILWRLSTPRVEPIRQGVHLPQDSMAQNSIAKRACLDISTLSSNTTTPPWPIRPSRALPRPNGPSRKGAAADIIDQFAERDAERDLEQSTMSDIACELDRHRAARAAHAEIGVSFGAAGEDEGDRRERQHVVDHGGLAEQALVRGQRRLGADDAAAAFEAFQQRGFLAADIGAGADADFKIEALAGAADARAEICGARRGGD